MQAKFSLLAYVPGQKTRVTVSIKKGTTMPVGATAFYVRFRGEDGKRHDEPLGSNFQVALTEVRTRQFAKDTDIELPKKPSAAPKRPMAEAIRQYLDDLHIVPNIGKGTILAYGVSLGLFSTFLGYLKKEEGRDIAFAEDMTEKDMFLFSAWLRSTPHHRGGLRKKLTVYNHFANVIIFFGAIGINLGIPSEKWGKPKPRKAKRYSDEELRLLFAHSTPEEEDIFKSFFYTGLRNQELANLTYGDIDFKHSLWRVEEKEGGNAWTPKTDDSGRIISVHSKHTQRIHQRMLAKGKTELDLIFPNRRGKASRSFLFLLKGIAKRAGVTGRVDIHKMRATCATNWLKEGVKINEVARRLGHANLKTIQQYLELVDLEDPESREQTDKQFDKWETEKPSPGVIPFAASR